MEVWQCIKERRSIRKFSDQPLSREQMTRILEAAVWAPSGGNRQTWRFVAVTDQAMVHKVKLLSPGIGGRPTAVIAIAHDPVWPDDEEARIRRESVIKMDSAMAAQNILLAAHDMGLGSCVIASFHAQGVAKLLNLPGDWHLHLLVTLGWPAQEPKPPARKFEEIIWWDKYDG